MMILAGERQLGQRVSPNCEQKRPTGVAPSAGIGFHPAAQLGHSAEVSFVLRIPGGAPEIRRCRYAGVTVPMNDREPGSGH
jgi:hypothetical protein